MLLPFLVLTLLLLPGAVRAQLVEVQSGEHPGFSRLALTFPKEIDWRFGRTPDGYELRVPDKDLRFDLSTVFTFIPRDRLSAIWVDPATGTLRMTLRCACHGTAFSLQPRIVVIDLADGPPIPGSGFETAIDSPDGPALRPLAARTEPRPKARPPTVAVTPTVDTMPPDAPVFAPAKDVPAKMAVPRPTVPLPLPSTDKRATGLQDQLLLELGRAASQGLVEPVTTLPARPDHPDILPLESRSALPAVAPTRPGQMRVLKDPDATSGDLTAKGAICLPEADLALQAWGDDSPLPEQIAKRRSAMLGEFDVPDQSVVLALARLYLYAGFGAEAKAILATFAPDSAELPVVRGVAAVLDGAEPTGVFIGMEVCDTTAALWAVLSQPDLENGDRVAHAAISRSFSALPLHLRRHLGPRLAERLIAMGDSGTAQAVRDAVGRAPGDHGSALGMIDARIDLDRGDVAEAEEKLGNVVAADGPLSPDALVTLANSIVDRGGVLDEEMLINLEALEREYRGAAESPEVRLAVARAIAAAGFFDRAFDEFAQDDPRIQAAIWPILAARGSDGDILRHAVAAPGPETLKQAGPAAMALADRLIEIGFPDAALPWIVQDETDEVKMLTARAALGLRDGRAALRSLSGQDGDEAANLRSKAHQILDQADEAVAVLTVSDRNADAIRVAWRAQNWDGVRTLGSTEPDDALVQSLSRLAQPSPEGAERSDDEKDGPLARGRALLSVSDQTRAAVDDLLKKVPGLTQD